MKAYGGVKRIAFLSPYYPVANREVARYFTESGFEVVRDIYLECKSWTAIAEVTTDVLRDKLIALNGDAGDVDAIIQVGTNLRHGLPGGGSRDVAWQAGHRHQHGDVLACAAPERDPDKIPGLGAVAGGFLNRSQNRPGFVRPGATASGHRQVFAIDYVTRVVVHKVTARDADASRRGESGCLSGSA